MKTGSAAHRQKNKTKQKAQKNPRKTTHGKCVQSVCASALRKNVYVVPWLIQIKLLLNSQMTFFVVVVWKQDRPMPLFFYLWNQAENREWSYWNDLLLWFTTMKGNGISRAVCVPRCGQHTFLRLGCKIIPRKKNTELSSSTEHWGFYVLKVANVCLQ